MNCGGSSACSILCHGDETCNNIRINCDHTTQCSTFCDGTSSCFGENSNLDCGVSSCHINCNGDEPICTFSIDSSQASRFICTGNNCNDIRMQSSSPTISPSIKPTNLPTISPSPTITSSGMICILSTSFHERIINSCL